MIYFNLRGMDEPMEHRRSRKFDDEGHDRTSVLTHCLLVESSTESNMQNNMQVRC